VIENYLRELRRRGVRDKRVLDEVRGHLEEAAVQVGEEQAIKQFGTSRALARSLRPFPYVALALALISGIAIGYVDSRPRWDDTGMSALFIFAATVALGCWRPRLAWCWALAVGGFVPLIEISGDGDGGSLLALGVAAMGAGIGWLMAHGTAALRPHGD
jgi:hypothetical protein